MYDDEFVSLAELLRKSRWSMLIGIPYVVSLFIQYTPANWFTVPTIGLLVIAWFIAVISFVE